MLFGLQVVASKYLYDEGIDEEVVNSEWAENSHVDLYELNAMEIEFLEAMVDVLC